MRQDPLPRQPLCHMILGRLQEQRRPWVSSALVHHRLVVSRLTVHTGLPSSRGPYILHTAYPGLWTDRAPFVMRPQHVA